jgi:DNA-binding XRE family transcriptional regulator
MLFNERLKQLRKEKKITQKALATAINRTERYGQELEYGKTKPGFDILIALADYFDVSIDYLVGRSDDPIPGGPPCSSTTGNTAIAKDNVVMGKGASMVNTAASESSIIIEHGEGADKTRVALPPGTPGDVIAHVAKELNGR